MTEVESNLKTKDKILFAANILFASNGFGNTSMRDIADKAEVNLAAINYHFISKENLYWEVYQYNFEWVNLGIQSLDEDNIDTAELASRTFKFFLDEKVAIKNIFKIILSDHAALYEETLDSHKKNDQMFGPPGQVVFFNKIAKECSASDKNIAWAVKTFFSLITHHGLIMGTEFFKNKCGGDQSLSHEAVDAEIRKCVCAILSYLMINPGDK